MAEAPRSIGVPNIPPYCGVCEREFDDTDEVAVIGAPHYTHVHRENCLMRFAVVNCNLMERLSLFGIYATLRSLARMADIHEDTV